MEESTKNAKIQELEERIKRLEENAPKKKVSIVVFSGDLDRCLAAFIIATGAVSMGIETTMFFTFWGLNVLRKKKEYTGKEFLNKMMTLISPGGPHQLPLSKMHFFGMGTRMMKKKMADKNVTSLEDLIEIAQELGVEMIACEMTRDLLHYKETEILEGVEVGGVGTFLGEALESKTTLFI